jgi:hypothetical protein
MRIVPAQSTGMAAGVLGFFGGKILPRAPSHGAPDEDGFAPDGFAQAPSKKTSPRAMGMRYFIKVARMGRAAGFWQKPSRLSHHEKPPIGRPCEQQARWNPAARVREKRFLRDRHRSDLRFSTRPRSIQSLQGEENPVQPFSQKNPTTKPRRLHKASRVCYCRTGIHPTPSLERPYGFRWLFERNRPSAWHWKPG